MTYAHTFIRYKIIDYKNLLLVEKNTQRKNQLKKLKCWQVTDKIDNKIGQNDVIILAVKPQDFNNLSPLLKQTLQSDCILLSIMAGVTISSLEKKLDHKSIIRAMPNMPAQVGMGVTGFAASNSTTLAQIRKIENLLNTTGKTVFFDDESQLDAVTALSGSGPAYFFYFVKSLVDAGEAMGLDKPTATMLVNQTMLGSFHIFNSSTKSLDELIASVSSKGGTTEAAFKILSKYKINTILKTALINAKKRANELSKI